MAVERKSGARLKRLDENAQRAERLPEACANVRVPTRQLRHIAGAAGGSGSSG